MTYNQKVEDKIMGMNEQLFELEDELSCDPENLELMEKVQDLKYEIKSICRTCGSPDGRAMYDCQGIYAGVYCSEDCCPIRMDHYTQADVDEDIEPHDGEVW